MTLQASPLRPLTTAELRRVTSSSVIGTAVEWYDFYLFAVSSSVVFGPLFFPQFDPTAGTISSFATFAVGFLVRPFGAAFFGHYGDRIGRKNVLIITLILMGTASALIGVLPTHAAIGIWGAVLLTVLRAVQGFGAGAEYGGAVLMLAETAPKKRRGLYAGLPYVGVALGLLAANGAFALVSRLPKNDLLSWGWRIPFLFSIVGVAIGLVMRLRLHETPVFQEVKASGLRVKLPFAEVFRHSRRNLFCAWGAQMGDKSLAYIFESLVIVYVTKQVGLSTSLVLTALLVASAAQFVTVPAFAALSDRIGRRPVYILGAILSAVFAYPFFILLDTGNTVLLFASVLFASAIAKTMMTAAQAAWFAEMFPAQVRYSGFALAREVAAPLSGGLAPLIAVSLLSLGGGEPHWVVVYMVAICLITVVSVWLGPETYKVDMFPEQDHSPDTTTPEHQPANTSKAQR
jgi:MFS transporter, MHS family, shikimate and dehydroshikimate transport protein